MRALFGRASGAAHLASVLCLLLVLPPVVWSADAEGLYEATVTVAARDNEAARNQGFAEAMREMLVRLTGRTDTASRPAVARALAAPQPYVDFWAYDSQPSPEPDGGEQIVLQVTFFQAAVQGLLEEAGIPVWPQNRPATLLWVVVQDEFGEYRMVGSPLAAETDLLEQVHAAAQRRGVPLLDPLLDFADQRALRPEQAWALDLDTIRAASQRYGTESVLLLRIFRAPGAQVIGKAVYLFRERVLEYEVFDGPLDTLLEGGIDLVAQELSSNYAVLLSGVDNSTAVQLTVDDVGTVESYASLLDYLDSIAVVSALQVQQVAGSTLTLQLQVGGQFRQLIESIALDRRLEQLGEVTRESQRMSMHYRWLGR